jgi:hypothetical protein
MPFADLKSNEKAELLVAYACMILADEKAPITEENINKLVAAAKGAAPAYYGKAFGTHLSR